MSMTEESTYQYLGEFSKIIDRLEAKNETIAKLNAQITKLKQELKECNELLHGNAPGALR